MPDADLVQPGNVAFKEFKVLEVEVVPRVQSKSEFPCSPCRIYISAYSRLAVPGCELLGVSFGIELDPVGSRCSCALHHSYVRIHEDGNANAPFLEHRYHLF